MSESTDRSERHLSEETLVSLAEGVEPGNGDRVHLEACEACRARLEATRAVLGALADDPPMPDEATFAARRARIREAIDGSRRPAARLHPVRARARWWIPLAAAAALATILVTRPSPETEGPGVATRAATDDPVSVQSPPVEEPELPVLAEADRAVAEATRDLEVDGAITDDGADEETIHVPDRIDVEAIDLVLEDLETTDPILSSGSDENDRLLLEERFASLPVDDRAAILNDLSTMFLERQE